MGRGLDWSAVRWRGLIRERGAERAETEREQRRRLEAARRKRRDKKGKEV
jgi:hypothetical protein